MAYLTDFRKYFFYSLFRSNLLKLMINKNKEAEIEEVIQELSQRYPEQEVRSQAKAQGKLIDNIMSFSNLTSASMLIAGVIAWQIGILFDVVWLNDWIVPILLSSVVYLAIPDKIKTGNWFYAVFIFSLAMSFILDYTIQVSHFYTLLAAQLIVERVSRRMRSRSQHR